MVKKTNLKEKTHNDAIIVPHSMGRSWFKSAIGSKTQKVYGVGRSANDHQHDMSGRVRARTKDTGRVTRPAGTNNPAPAVAAAAVADAAARPLHGGRSDAINKRPVA